MGNTLASVSNSVTAGSDGNCEDYDLQIHFDSLDEQQVQKGWLIKISRELQGKTVERLKNSHLFRRNNNLTRTPPPSATSTADEITGIF